MTRQAVSDGCVIGLLLTIFLGNTVAIALGESGNLTVASFLIMFVCGVATGWRLDLRTNGKWQLYRTVKNWHPPFLLEVGLVLVGAVWYVLDAAMLMRGAEYEVTVERAAVWLLLTVGMGASFSRALEDRKKILVLEKIKEFSGRE